MKLEETETVYPSNLSHYQVNPYTYEDPDERLSITDFTIQRNFWRKFRPNRIESSEYAHEYFIELDPAYQGYRAMFINMQFMGTFSFLL